MKYTLIIISTFFIFSCKTLLHNKEENNNASRISSTAGTLGGTCQVFDNKIKENNSPDSFEITQEMHKDMFLISKSMELDANNQPTQKALEARQLLAMRDSGESISQAIESKDPPKNLGTLFSNTIKRNLILAAQNESDIDKYEIGKMATGLSELGYDLELRQKSGSDFNGEIQSLKSAVSTFSDYLADRDGGNKIDDAKRYRTAFALAGIESLLRQSSENSTKAYSSDDILNLVSRTSDRVEIANKTLLGKPTSKQALDEEVTKIKNDYIKNPKTSKSKLVDIFKKLHINFIDSQNDSTKKIDYEKIGGKQNNLSRYR